MSIDFPDNRKYDELKALAQAAMHMHTLWKIGHEPIGLKYLSVIVSHLASVERFVLE